MVKKDIRQIELIQDDCRNHVSRIAEHDNCLVIYDPPYNEWDQVINVEATSKIAFTSPQRRHETEQQLGKPRNEIVWFFKDGRWVSKNLPRITHNYIFIYGKTSDAAVGCDQEIKTMKKGSRIMITGYNQEGSQTIDHYSLLGFTKAYGAAKKNCS